MTTENCKGCKPKAVRKASAKKPSHEWLYFFAGLATGTVIIPAVLTIVAVVDILWGF
jgi:hypothetical protein